MKNILVLLSVCI